MNGARIITKILNNPILFEQWQADILVMVKRMKAMRALLRAELEQIGCKPPIGLSNWNHITNQIGMFS